MKKFLLGLTAGFVGATALLATAQSATNRDEAFKQLDFFGDAFERISANYVREASYSELVGYAIDGMMTRLDPHSTYWDKKHFADLTAATRNELASIGIKTRREYGFERVIPQDGGPAALAGIRRGDYIAAIDDRSVVGLPRSDVLAMFSGPKDSNVKLTVLRKNERRPLQFNVMRTIAQPETVKFQRVGDIGYVRIYAFNEKTDADLKKSIADLRTQIGPNLKGFVLDLRDNAGGLLDSVIGVADDFLNGGKIVSLRGRTRDNNREYEARRGDLADGKPMAVLINEDTASGAEIVAAALQGNHRAKIIGMISSGDGVIQTVIPIARGEGGTLSLKTADYYLASGRAMEPDGVEPDIAVSQVVEGYDADNSPLPSPATRSSRRNVIYPEPGRTYDDFQLSIALKELGQG